MYNILYVDDDPQLLELCKIFLDRKWGINVNITISVDNALTLLQNGTFDAIISDYEMPEMDGISFLKMIRVEYHTIPFILFTGKGREDIVIEALNNGADYYLQKGGQPMAQFSELVNLIEKAVDKKRAENELNQKFEELARLYEEIAAQNEEIKSSFGELAEREIELSKSERRFKTLIEHIPIGIIIHYRGRIRYVNPIGVKSLGYQNPDELIGQNPMDVVSPARRGNIKRRMLDSSVSNTIFIREKFLRKDGTEIPVEITGLSIPIDDIRANMTIFRDISSECNQKVALHQVTNKLNIMTSVTKHDFINQVNTLMATMELIMEESIPDSLSPLINILNVSVNNISNNIKIYQEYESLGLKNPSWVFLKEILYHATYNSYSPDIISYNCNDVEVYADPFIKKVFENLIDNSLRHGKHVSKISINSNIVSDNLFIIYQDDGCGIPDDKKEKIFEKGFGENTGLGLYLIKEILAVTEIAIKECGIFGKGVEFEIIVPAGRWRKIE